MGRVFRFGSNEDNSRYGEDQEDQAMKVVGMPESFWIVTMPTATSELGDCCFQCTYETFALQIRGGLSVQKIIGIFADEQLAKAAATRLIEARDAEPSDTDAAIHTSPWPEWFATQEDVRSVWICKKDSMDKVKVEPPVAWGTAWAWNLTEDGTGIVLRRTT